MESCVPLLSTFLLLLAAFGAAWAQQETDPSETSEEALPPSNIDSWNEEDNPESTFFGMGFESRIPVSDKPGRQSSDRIVNNW